MDTAPTGHTLLLLDATGAYHRELVRNFGLKVVSTPLTRLRNPGYTKVLIVTLPEPTPVLEAEQLQAELRRAGIEPFAWVINASLAATHPTDPILVKRAQAEIKQIQKVQERCATRVVVVPWQTGARRTRTIAAFGQGNIRPSGEVPALVVAYQLSRAEHGQSKMSSKANCVAECYTSNAGSEPSAFSRE